MCKLNIRYAQATNFNENLDTNCDVNTHFTDLYDGNSKKNMRPMRDTFRLFIHRWCVPNIEHIAVISTMEIELYSIVV